MINDPVLFIDSVSDKKDGKENQETFDSRHNINKKKNLILHRIEDIKAMTFFKIKIYIFIQTKQGVYEGFVENIDDKEIYLKDNDLLKRVVINDIEDIIIKKIWIY